MQQQAFHEKRAEEVSKLLANPFSWPNPLALCHYSCVLMFQEALKERYRDLCEGKERRDQKLVSCTASC